MKYLMRNQHLTLCFILDYALRNLFFGRPASYVGEGYTLLALHVGAVETEVREGVGLGLTFAVVTLNKACEVDVLGGFI